MVFHVLNRGVGRMRLFAGEADYAAFQRVVEEALRVTPIRICAYCWMPTHWHFVLWPQRDGELSEFMQRMTNMHTQRWQRAKDCVGCGHLYQGRFKSFPVESDDYFYRVVRYVERNALRAGLVARAEDWLWSSLRPRFYGQAGPTLAEWPLPQPSDWLHQVQTPQTEAELNDIRKCVQRGRPYGTLVWVEQVAERLGLQAPLRARGRPYQPIS